MKRVHLFEFTDKAWYPQVFRGIQTDYLQFVATLNKSHQNLIPLFQRALENSPEKQIVDLCSGGTGPWKNLSDQELEELTTPISNEDYVWEIGLASTGTPIFAYTYLVGYPKSNHN